MFPNCINLIDRRVLKLEHFEMFGQLPQKQKNDLLLVEKTTTHSILLTLLKSSVSYVKENMPRAFCLLAPQQKKFK